MDGDSVVVSAARDRERERERETVRDARNFKRTDNDTQENIHINKVGERKESI